MSLINITRDTFREVVKVDGVVLIEWWAPQCGVCRQSHPFYRRVAEKHPEHVFARINLAEEEYLAEFFEVLHTPSLSVYREGLLLLQKPGSFDEAALEAILDQVVSLDMDRVRQDIEASE